MEPDTRAQVLRISKFGGAESGQVAHEGSIAEEKDVVGCDRATFPSSPGIMWIIKSRGLTSFQRFSRSLQCCLLIGRLLIKTLFIPCKAERSGRP